ncbi:DUF6364 family protein [Shimazuella sp. AN120528]|uniref:DUF6364 family protein n=1 Tax=Shimazuella soli TaxID=1892854 RepID=UPI001F10428A|nr:DUF6364 family protein [Shimazuella soli]
MGDRKKFTTTLDSELIQQLKMQAVKENTDASKIIERLLKNYFKELSDLREG